MHIIEGICASTGLRGAVASKGSERCKVVGGCHSKVMSLATQKKIEKCGKIWRELHAPDSVWDDDLLYFMN